MHLPTKSFGMHTFSYLIVVCANLLTASSRRWACAMIKCTPLDTSTCQLVLPVLYILSCYLRPLLFFVTFCFAVICHGDIYIHDTHRMPRTGLQIRQVVACQFVSSCMRAFRLIDSYLREILNRSLMRICGMHLCFFLRPSSAISWTLWFFEDRFICFSIDNCCIYKTAEVVGENVLRNQEAWNGIPKVPERTKIYRSYELTNKLQAQVVWHIEHWNGQFSSCTFVRSQQAFQFRCQ